LAGGWLLVCLVVFVSLIPNPPQPVTLDYADKLGHGFAYALMSLWLCQIYLSARSRVIVFVALVGLGIGLEFAQGWTGYRHFGIWDMAANAIGVLLGFMLVRTPLGRLFISIESALR
jgi:VanZ family protein